MITLEKAIEILTLDKTCDFEGETKDLVNAHQLGIEALKRLDDHRHGKTLPFERWLPGESEE